MALPGTLTTLTVTGTYDSAIGTAQAGVVVFTPSETVLDAAGKVVITATPIPVALSGGSFGTVLPCTDNAGLVPPNWQYSANVAVAGAQQVFTFYLPHALGGTAGTVDITQLAPVPGVASPTGIYYLPNATSPPSSGPSGGGGFLYAFGGDLYWVNGDSTPVIVGPSPGEYGYGLIPPAGDIGGTGTDPTVISTHLTSPLPVQQGGTGGATLTVFNVMNYGATGNGMLATDGSITALSATLTSASLVPFSGTRTAWIPGAGSASSLLQTTITCATSGTATLGTAAATTVGGAAIYWGTDDTAAFQAAIVAAVPTAGQLIVPPANYLISQPLTIIPTNTGSSNQPQAVPGITGLTCAGYIGDTGLPMQEGATQLVALPTFPHGNFLIDYQEAGTPYGPSGARVGGFSLICNSYAAGFRAQGSREFRVQDMTITNPAAPATGVAAADGANGGFSITYLTSGGGNAGAYNIFDHITVWGAGGDSFYDSTNSENTYIGCRSAAPVSANYHVGNKACNAYIDCAYGGGLYGVSVDAGGTGKFTNLSIFTGVPWPTKNALLITGGWQYNLPYYYPPRFTGCDFINNPNSGVTEADGSVVRFKASSTYQMGAVFTGCYFGTGTGTYMTDWVYSDTNIGGGAGDGGTVTFRDCVFAGTPATSKYNDQSGIMQFFNCTGVAGTAGGSGGLSPVGGSPHIIAAKILAAPAASIAFSSIPQGYAMLRLVVVGASAASAEFDYFFVRINGDTGSNYDVQYHYGLNVTAGAAPRTAVTGWWIPNASLGDMPGANATAASAGILDLEIPAYAATTFHKVGLWRSGFIDSATSASDEIATSMITTWRNTAAITSLSILLPSASTFTTGTTALLYAT